MGLQRHGLETLCQRIFVTAPQKVLLRLFAQHHVHGVAKVGIGRIAQVGDERLFCSRKPKSRLLIRGGCGHRNQPVLAHDTVGVARCIDENGQGRMCETKQEVAISFDEGVVCAACHWLAFCWTIV